jgi:hypothetical protein
LTLKHYRKQTQHVTRTAAYEFEAFAARSLDLEEPIAPELLVCPLPYLMANHDMRVKGIVLFWRALKMVNENEMQRRTGN